MFNLLLHGFLVKKAYDEYQERKKIEEAKAYNEKNIKRLEHYEECVNENLANLGKMVAMTMSDFSRFSRLSQYFFYEPAEFKKISKGYDSIPSLNIEELNSMSAEASEILSLPNLSSRMLAGLCISGSIGLPGLVLSSAIPLFGLGMLLFNSKKHSDDIWEQVYENEELIDDAISLLSEIDDAVLDYTTAFERASDIFYERLEYIEGNIISAYSLDQYGMISWESLDNEEQDYIMNTVKITGLLYEMCKLKLIRNKQGQKVIVNHTKIDQMIEKADYTCDEVEAA